MLLIKDLEKSYGKFKALNKLNLDIKQGEIFGFIGPNGAGKSTTMKIVSGLLTPDDGEVYVDGIDAIKNNKVGKTPFYICAGDYSVGFGKSLLFCAIHQAFKRKIPTILLLNDSDLFKQFKREIPPLLPGEDIVFVQGGKINRWGNFNVAMVQSVSQNIKKYQYELTKIGIVLIDEADIIDNKRIYAQDRSTAIKGSGLLS